MTRGPKPEPAALKRAKGNPGKRRIIEAPPLAGVAGSKIVAHPSLSKDARAVWNKLAPELERLQFLRPTDVDAFARYCEHLSKWWSLTRAIRREGETYLAKSEHNPEGLHRLNPKFLIRERIENRLETLEDRFGLTPASRHQILRQLSMLPMGDLFDRVGQADANANLVGGAPNAGPPVNETPSSPVGLLARAATSLPN